MARYEAIHGPMPGTASSLLIDSSSSAPASSASSPAATLPDRTWIARARTSSTSRSAGSTAARTHMDAVPAPDVVRVALGPSPGSNQRLEQRNPLVPGELVEIVELRKLGIGL